MRSQRLREGGGDLVGELLGRDAGGGGGALDFLAVLVGAGEEEGVVAEEAVAAGEDVRDDGRVGVADVRARVDVVDRGGEVELLGLVWHRVRFSLQGDGVTGGKGEKQRKTQRERRLRRRDAAESKRPTALVGLLRVMTRVMGR